MPLQTADRLAQQHQRDLATIAGGTASAVFSLALGADPAAISTWYFSAVDGILARIQAGNAQARRSSTEFLRRHAAMNGVDLTPVPSSLDMTRARTSMRVTGPVAFKTAIGAGLDQDLAVRSMAVQMSGASQRLVMAGERDTFEATMTAGRGIVGYRRVLVGKSCGFCAMLASRGGVYVTAKSASVAKDGLKFHDHCVPAGTLVSGPTVEKGFRRWYEGELVIVGLAGGDELAITPNHPVLTSHRGWVPAGQLRLGEDVVERSGVDWEALDVPHEHEEPAPIEDVWRARRVDGLRGVPVSAEDFHGDGAGTDGDVEVVGADGLFALVRDAALCEPCAQLVGAPAGAPAVAGPLLAEGDAGLVLVGALAPTYRGMGGFGQRGATVWSEFGHSQLGGRVAPPALDAGLVEPPGYRAARYAETLTEAQFGLALEVCPDGVRVGRDALGARSSDHGSRFDPASAQCDSNDLGAMADLGGRLRERLARGIQLRRVVELRRIDFSGHVYNLQTVEGWYSANGIIISNCNCAIAPLYEHEDDPADFRELQRQWQRVTAGKSGNAARVAWREHWEGRATPAARQRMGLAASEPRPSLPGGGVGAAVPEIPAIRPLLAQAKSTAEVERILTAEMQRLTGQRPVVVLTGMSSATAREVAEGVLRGVERFPGADLRQVIVHDLSRREPGLYALHDSTLGAIEFNEARASLAGRTASLEQLAKDVSGDIPWHPRGTGSWTGISVHEFGHAVDLGTVGRNVRPEVNALIIRRAAERDANLAARRAAGDLIDAQDFLAGGGVDGLIRREISEYATRNGDELIAEAFADVLMNGPDASPLSREIFDLLEAEYRRGGRRVGVPGITSASEAGTDFDAMLTRAKKGNAATAQTVYRFSGNANQNADLFPDRAERVAIMDAFAGYRGIGSRRINSALREGGPITDTRVLAMDRAFAVSPLRGDVVVYRGARGTFELGPQETWGDSLVGRTWTERSYTSTSVNPDKARPFASDGVLFRIVAPEGTPGVGIRPAMRIEAREQEILLGRGLTFRVVRDHGTSAPPGISLVDPARAPVLRVLDVEVVPAGRVVPAAVPTPILSKLTVPQLRALAKDRGVTLPAKARKADIVAALEGPAKPTAKAVVPDLSKLKVADLRALAADQKITLPPRATKAQIVEALQQTPDQRRAAAQRAVRDAARERNRLIEQATGTEKLLAHLDEILAKGADAKVVRQALDEKLITPEQLFGNADPAVLASLRTAFADGDVTRLRAAITRQSTARKLKVVGGKAGTKVTFDPDLMESVGGAEIRAGTRVQVVTRGASVTLPDGSTLVLSKAKVALVPAKAAGTSTRAGVPEYKPPTTISTEDRARAARLVKRDPQIFAMARDRFGDVSTSGNLSRADAEWLQSLYVRERAFVERLAQTARIDEYLARAARAAGSTLAKFRAEVAAKLRMVFADKRIGVRVSSEDSLRAILRDGRFKTQFEGAKRAPGLRASVETRRLGEEIHGIARDIDPTKRPIYGYLMPDGIRRAGVAGDAGDDLLSAYGRIQVVLRSEVRARTTVTIGDSLDLLGFVQPSAVDAPTAFSANPGSNWSIDKIDRIFAEEFRRSSYVEAQINGGVSVDDIAEIIFPSTPTPAMADALAARGIPWRVMG